MSKAEDTLTKIVITQEKSMATIRSIEIQMGQVAKQIAQITKGLSDKFSSNTITNPKEHCNYVVTEKKKKR